MRKKGFTILEVMITVGVIGVMSVIVIYQFRTMITQAKVNMAAMNIKQIESQLSLYIMSTPQDVFGYSDFGLDSLNDLKLKGYKIPANTGDFIYNIGRYVDFYELFVITRFNSQGFFALRLFKDGHEEWLVAGNHPWKPYLKVPNPTVV